MRDPWQLLHDGGVPLAGERDGRVPTEGEMAEAALTVLRDDSTMSARESEALGSWLRAWRHHFASSFARAFGPEASRVEAWAEAHVEDANRSLKLRRIAVENLSAIL